jgi:hypothetical protein
VQKREYQRTCASSGDSNADSAASKAKSGVLKAFFVGKTGIQSPQARFSAPKTRTSAHKREYLRTCAKTGASNANFAAKNANSGVLDAFFGGQMPI